MAPIDCARHHGRVSRAEVLYRAYVVDEGLERRGLFEALLSFAGRIETALYPGCFIHVTPSAYIPHVVYVDRNETARAFFADEAAVRQIAGIGKRYRRPSYVRYIHQDFTAALPVPEASFDLLLALYAGGISRACARYLREGGLLLTNSHQADAEDALAMPDLTLVAVAHERRGEVSFTDRDLDGYLTRKRRAARQRARQATGRPEYERHAGYYAFRRVCPSGGAAR
jgi:hypothetical protein